MPSERLKELAKLIEKELDSGSNVDFILEVLSKHKFGLAKDDYAEITEKTKEPGSSKERVIYLLLLYTIIKKENKKLAYGTLNLATVHWFMEQAGKLSGEEKVKVIKKALGRLEKARSTLEYQKNERIRIEKTAEICKLGRFCYYKLLIDALENENDAIEEFCNGKIAELSREEIETLEKLKGLITEKEFNYVQYLQAKYTFLNTAIGYVVFRKKDKKKLLAYLGQLDEFLSEVETSISEGKVKKSDVADTIYYVNKAVAGSYLSIFKLKEETDLKLLELALPYIEKAKEASDFFEGEDAVLKKIEILDLESSIYRYLFELTKSRDYLKPQMESLHNLIGQFNNLEQEFELSIGGKNKKVYALTKYALTLFKAEPYNLKVLSEAQTSYEKAIKLIEEIKDKIGTDERKELLEMYAVSHSNIARILYRKAKIEKDKDKAKELSAESNEHNAKAIRYVKYISNPYIRYMTGFNTANALNLHYHNLRNKNKSYYYCQKAIDYCRKLIPNIKDENELEQFLDVLSGVYMVQTIRTYQHELLDKDCFHSYLEGLTERIQNQIKEGPEEDFEMLIEAYSFYSLLFKDPKKANMALLESTIFSYFYKLLKIKEAEHTEKPNFNEKKLAKNLFFFGLNYTRKENWDSKTYRIVYQIRVYVSKFLDEHPAFNVKISRKLLGLFEKLDWMIDKYGDEIIPEDSSGFFEKYKNFIYDRSWMDEVEPLPGVKKILAKGKK